MSGLNQRRAVRYFAYGSNLSLARLRVRTPSACRVGCYVLAAHALRFHKIGRDGSGKCDALFTGDPRDTVPGAVFEIDVAEKWRLDEAEGLGNGYEEKWVQVVSAAGETLQAVTYYATRLDANLKPYSWYMQHVLCGARESGLPAAHARWLQAVASIEDPDRGRDNRERAIYGGVRQRRGG